MLLSLALLIIGGFLLGELCHRLKLPRLIGMLFTGILLGPYVFDLIAPELHAISKDLRMIALVIILIRAGLALDLKDLKKVGRPAVLIAFIPATFEMLLIVLLGPVLLGLSLLESAMLGAIVAAVSPAVVIPRMLDMIDKQQGTKKAIPQMIMAGASVDDIYVIVVFAALLRVYQTGTFDMLAIIFLPVSILLGIMFGGLIGLFLVKIFKRFHMRDSNKVLTILSIALVFIVIEETLASYLPFSGLIAVLSMGIMILHRYPVLAERLVVKFEKVWIFAELLLFALVGALVDIRLLPLIGVATLLLLFVSLLVRSIGTLLASHQKHFNWRERLFIIGAYLPKATVQASIGAIPLAYGVANGDVILAVAILAILVTAPLGALFIDRWRERLST